MPTLDFQKPQLSDATWMVPMLQKSGSFACEYSFTTLYMWRKYYQNEIARRGDQLFLRTGSNAESTYMMPVGGDQREGVALLLEEAHRMDRPMRLFGAGKEDIEKLTVWFPGIFSYTLSPGDFDYIYNQSDLALLPGKPYHSKRNHIESFTRHYAWQYESLSDSNAKEVADMAKKWCKGKGNCADRGLQSEMCAIEESLQHIEELSLLGGLIRVAGEVVAFALGSPINDRVFDVHVEKAMSAYSNAYTVINREFSARALSAYPYINRENDLNIEGLRKAKASYRPAILLEKYLCVEMR